MTFDYKGFMRDFRIAELFGVDAIKDTFNRAKAEWSDNADYYGSFVMTLNHLLWYHYERDENELAELYNDLWQEANDSIFELFKGDELNQILAFLD